MYQDRDKWPIFCKYFSFQTCILQHKYWYRDSNFNIFYCVLNKQYDGIGLDKDLSQIVNKLLSKPTMTLFQRCMDASYGLILLILAHWWRKAALACAGPLVQWAWECLFTRNAPNQWRFVALGDATNIGKAHCAWHCRRIRIEMCYYQCLE